jgi:hypothetical protein
MIQIIPQMRIFLCAEPVDFRKGITYPFEMYHIRHLFGSAMLAGGADLAAVSALLGHRSITTTANTYIHVMQGAKEKAIGLLPSISTTNETMSGKVVKMAARKPNVIQ